MFNPDKLGLKTAFDSKDQPKPEETKVRQQEQNRGCPRMLKEREKQQRQQQPQM